MRYLVIIMISLSVIACQGKKRTVVQGSGIYYTCSMHPQIMQDKPGKCPICHMDLIPVEIKSGADPEAIMLSDQQMQLGNIQVDTVTMGVIGNETVLTATLNVDETKTTTVSARISGRIQRLYFKNEGDYISKGAKLYDLYSEEMNTAKQEYLLAIEKEKQLDNSIIDLHQLVKSAKTKLQLWGLSEAQITELEKAKKINDITSFYSPAAGYVILLESHEGDYVMEGGTIVRLANLSSLWAEAQVYTSQLSEFDPKATAIVRLPDLGREMVGTIQFVNPEINPDTRINLVRVAIPNPGTILKPGMPAYVVLKNKERNSLTLPINAVIRNEKMNTVWIMIDKKTFKSIMVETGLESGDRIEIRSGLKKGDIVVISGAYLLQSEYIFRKGANPMGGHDMSNM
jgi:membrane fusion protein, copper/silver efflux system